MNNKRRYKILDLFAGAGGFSLGFKLFSEDNIYPFEIVGSVEIDKMAANTIKSALIRYGLSEEEADRRVICDDITTDTAKKRIYKTCPEVDIIIGGPPCQSFSTIGPRSGNKEKQARFANDNRDSLFEHYIQIVNYYKPLFFVFENVVGITSKKNVEGIKYIDIIVNRLEGLGYDLVSENEDIREKYIILDAANYGVPQHRKRVFIIGNRCGVKNPYPERTHCPPEDSVMLGLLPYVTLKDAIGDLPRVIPKITLTPSQKGLKIKDVPHEKKLQIERRNKRRNNGLDLASYHWDNFLRHYNDGNLSRKIFMDFVKPLNTNNLLTGHIARSQQESDIRLFKGMKQGMTSKNLIQSDNPKYKELASLIKYKMDSFEDKYKKLSWNKPCNTIFAHMQKDGNRFIHPDKSQTRTLTVREAARMQSFPDDYIIEAPGNVRYKYIGNAVPPLLSNCLAKAIYQALRAYQNRYEVYIPGRRKKI